MKLSTAVALILIALSGKSALAEIRISSVISDHAVLQRDRPIHVWGWATPGSRLTARLHNRSSLAQADRLGAWSLYLQPEPAGGPYELTVSGDGAERTVHDLLIGDVWFASGQSNMEMPLDGFPPSAAVMDADKEIAGASNPLLRLLVVDHKSSDIPLSAIDAKWMTCTPQAARHFSAVAYFFGREIATREKVPIGLIDSSWGGTPADAWVSMDTLGSSPALLPAFASRAAFANEQTDLDAQIAAEKREDDVAKATGKATPMHPWHPYAASWSPGGLYNGMIAPFIPMTIRGFIWYQGESNASHNRAVVYSSLLSGLIGDWRARFNQGDLPFLFVQISSFQSPGDDWGLVRDQQRRTLAVANTAMIVTVDIGDANNVHPGDKQTVGSRLALAALSLAYGEPVPYRGPSFREATTERQPNGTVDVRVWFDDATGLNSMGKPITDFEVAGADHRFVPAEAHILDNSILVHSAALDSPRYVRFGWTSVVTNSLYNLTGLPASTFTSEQNPVH